jgi:hypothetical protein
VKTKTTKKRKIEIYFPTEEEKEALLETAEERGMSASKYILACIQEVETSLQRRPVSDEDMTEAREEIRALKAENEALRRENEQLHLINSRKDLELLLYKTKETPVRDEPVKEGIYKIDKKLIKILRSRKEIEGYELAQELGIDKMSKESSKKVLKDLEELAADGLVEATAEGWRWVGK